MTALISQLFIFALVGRLLAQDCKTASEPCSDTKQCCGGCCENGICTETYDSCILVDYPCLDDYCAPGEECYMYKPSSACEGCGMQRACRTAPGNPNPIPKPIIGYRSSAFASTVCHWLLLACVFGGLFARTLWRE